MSRKYLCQCETVLRIFLGDTRLIWMRVTLFLVCIFYCCLSRVHSHIPSKYVNETVDKVWIKLLEFSRPTIDT